MIEPFKYKPVVLPTGIDLTKIFPVAVPNKPEDKKPEDKKPAEGISTTTLIIGGAVALVAIILLARR